MQRFLGGVDIGLPGAVVVVNRDGGRVEHHIALVDAEEATDAGHKANHRLAVANDDILDFADVFILGVIDVETVELGGGEIGLLDIDELQRAGGLGAHGDAGAGQSSIRADGRGRGCRLGKSHGRREHCRGSERDDFDFHDVSSLCMLNIAFGEETVKREFGSRAKFLFKAQK